MTKRLLIIFGGLLWLCLVWALPITAQSQEMATGSGATLFGPNATPAQVSFALLSGNVAWLDNNNACANPAVGPRAMWIGVAITNHSTEALTNAVASLGGFSNASYALTADPTRYIGLLAPYDTSYAYWYVDYSGACPNPFGKTAQYTVTVTADNLSGPAYYVGTLTTQATNDVGAGDILTASAGSPIAVGQIFTQVVRYAFANATAILLQPTGDAGFRDDCFRLVGLTVTASNVSGIPAGTRHQLYFSAAAPKNNDTLTVAYLWQAQCQAASVSSPWANSGTSAPGKYSNKYGVHFTTLPTPSLSLDVTVTVTPTLLLSAGAVTYTMRLQNRFREPIVVNAIDFALPHNVVYKDVVAASAISNSNSSHYPALNAVGHLVWKGKPLLSYQVPASGTITAGVPGTLDLIFTADAPAVSGRYTAVASATVGSMDFGAFTTTFDVDLPTAVTLTAFEVIPQTDAVLVTWETASELDNAGFNLYRSAAPAGPWTLLNDTLIPPQNPGTTLGGFYEWRDTAVQPGALYYYKLEDIDVHGGRTSHGPIPLIMPGGGVRRYSIYIPLVFRNSPMTPPEADFRQD